MSEQEKKNCPEYQAGKVAAEWWQQLSEEQRKQMDIVDAFAYGVLHGWNNPNWISVEERLPDFVYPIGAEVKNTSDYVLVYNGYTMYISRLVGGKIHWWEDNSELVPTHWMPMPTPPQGKEANND